MNKVEYISRGGVYKVNHFRTIHLRSNMKNFKYQIINKVLISEKFLGRKRLQVRVTEMLLQSFPKTNFPLSKKNNFVFGISASANSLVRSEEMEEKKNGTNETSDAISLLA
jgi:hypothetical protein